MATERRNEFVAHLRYDKRRSSYSSFFDHDWAKLFLDLSDESRLSDACLVLVRDWKGIALVVRTPWLVIESLQSFHQGYFTQHPSFSQRLAREFVLYVTNRSSLSNMRKKELVAIVDELQKDVLDQMAGSKPAFDPDQTWNEFLQISEFPQSLWSAQRLAYGGLYYAYENFFQQCVSIAKNDPTYRALRVPDLIRDVSDVFGSELAKECLEDALVNTARLVRNCLTHDGGRESLKLRALQHDLPIEDSIVQILPEHTKKLYSDLKDKVLAVVRHAVNVPALKLRNTQQFL